MENHYVINVAKRYSVGATNQPDRYFHFFKATVRDEEQAKEAFAALKRSFPSPEYKVEATKWEGRGIPQNW